MRKKITKNSSRIIDENTGKLCLKLHRKFHMQCYEKMMEDLASLPDVSDIQNMDDSRLETPFETRGDRVESL